MADSDKPKVSTCGCPCHRGERGFHHCFIVCCARAGEVCAPPEVERVAVPTFKTITLPRLKKVYPGSIAEMIGCSETKEDSE
jgi:hypothetical protein